MRKTSAKRKKAFIEKRKNHGDFIGTTTRREDRNTNEKDQAEIFLSISSIFSSKSSKGTSFVDSKGKITATEGWRRGVFFRTRKNASRHRRFRIFLPTAVFSVFLETTTVACGMPEREGKNRIAKKGHRKDFPFCKTTERIRGFLRRCAAGIAIKKLNGEHCSSPCSAAFNNGSSSRSTHSRQKTMSSSSSSSV